MACERKSTVFFFRNQGTLDLLFSPLCHILPTGHTHTHTDTRAHTLPQSELCQLYQAGTFLASNNFYQK